MKASIWEPSNAFRTLSRGAQWTYLMLISQPQINNLGMLVYAPEKWVRMSPALTVEELEADLLELQQRWYIVVDSAVAELLVRSFIRHDKVWSQPKLVANARQLIREVESTEILEMLTSRHPWLDEPAWLQGRSYTSLAEQWQKHDRDTIAAHEADKPLSSPQETPFSGSPAPVENGAGKPPRVSQKPLSEKQGSSTGAGAGVGEALSSSPHVDQNPGLTEARTPARARPDARPASIRRTIETSLGGAAT